MESQTSARLRVTVLDVIANAARAVALDDAFALQTGRYASIECALGAANAAGV